MKLKVPVRSDQQTLLIAGTGSSFGRADQVVLRSRRIEVENAYYVAALAARVKAQIGDNILVEHIDDVGIQLERKPRVVAKLDTVMHGKIGLRERRRASLIAASRQSDLRKVVDINKRRDNSSTLRRRVHLEVGNIILP